MRKTKKVLSVILACITIFGTSVTAFAADESTNSNENIEVVNLSQNIDAREIEEIKESVVSNIICEDGTEIPMTTVVTIEDASVSSNARAYSANANNSYKITVSATADTTQDTTSAGNNSRKIDSDSADRNSKGVVASITLQLTWTDLSGVNNRLDKVSGSLTKTKGTVTKASLRYGDGYRSAILWTSKNVIGKTSFSYSPKMTAIDPSADYAVNFAESSVQLYVSVSASVFQ